MTIQTRHSSPSSSLTAGFDAADVDPVNDMLIEHVRDCAIGMNLADCVRTLGLVFQCIGLEGWDHDLVSHTTIMITTPFVFAQVVLVDQGLSLFSESLQVHHNRDGWEHVPLEH